MTSDIPMTFEGKKKLEEELDYLIKVERERTKAAIVEARAHGDLKENAEYSAAKEKQSMIEGKIQDLQARLSRARVVEINKIKSEVIVFGATITLQDTESESEFTYQIVGDEEADIKKNKISYLSPLGKALIGKSEGDTVIVKAPKGEIEYEVINFEYK